MRSPADDGALVTRTPSRSTYRTPPARRRAGSSRWLAVVAVVLVLGAAEAVDKLGTGGGGRPLYALGEQTLPLVDESRTMVTADGRSSPRTLTTYVRYPAAGRPGPVARRGAPAARGGPFPLVIFGHGFAQSPATYQRLIDAWARAGYVVAAPVFPLENADAPGGPYRADLPNQPGDVSYVIENLLSRSAAGGGPLSGLIDPGRIAVAGHSDGGDTALALAYDASLRNPRVRATVVLAGSQMPGLAGWQVRPGSPPLLAVQGSADPTNPPADTRAYWTQAARPKYLLTVAGAGHLAPYSRPGPQLSLVRQATLDFLARYLRRDAAAGRRLLDIGRRPDGSAMQARLPPGAP